jgi:hypothetical protein
MRRVWHWLWSSDSPTWLGLKVTEVRAAAGAACAICLAAGISDSSSDHSRHMLTYLLWYGAAGAFVALVIVATTVIIRKRHDTAAHTAVTPPTPHVGLHNRETGIADVSDATFDASLDTAVVNDGIVDASRAQFGVHRNDAETDIR